MSGVDDTQCSSRKRCRASTILQHQQSNAILRYFTGAAGALYIAELAAAPPLTNVLLQCSAELEDLRRRHGQHDGVKSLLLTGLGGHRTPNAICGQLYKTRLLSPAESARQAGVASVARVKIMPEPMLHEI